MLWCYTTVSRWGKTKIFNRSYKHHMQYNICPTLVVFINFNSKTVLTRIISIVRVQSLFLNLDTHLNHDDEVEHHSLSAKLYNIFKMLYLMSVLEVILTSRGEWCQLSGTFKIKNNLLLTDKYLALTHFESPNWNCHTELVIFVCHFNKSVLKVSLLLYVLFDSAKSKDNFRGSLFTNLNLASISVSFIGRYLTAVLDSGDLVPANFVQRLLIFLLTLFQIGNMILRNTWALTWTKMVTNFTCFE